METQEKEFIVITGDRFIPSTLRSVKAILVILVVIGTGALLESDAMQWLGFLMIVIVAVSRAGMNLRNRMTAQQAADHIKGKFGAVAK